jgi:site-specific recombinase XerD
MPYYSVRNVFDSACERAGLKGVTPHTLRHTFASRLVMTGMDLWTIQDLEGWKRLAMVERYPHAIHSTPQAAGAELSVSG